MEMLYCDEESNIHTLDNTLLILFVEILKPSTIDQWEEVYRLCVAAQKKKKDLEDEKLVPLKKEDVVKNIIKERIDSLEKEIIKEYVARNIIKERIDSLEKEIIKECVDIVNERNIHQSTNKNITGKHQGK